MGGREGESERVGAWLGAGEGGLGDKEGEQSKAQRMQLKDWVTDRRANRHCD